MNTMTRVCIDCGTGFAMSESEKKFYGMRDFVLPKRCAACRHQRKLLKQDTALRHVTDSVRDEQV